MGSLDDFRTRASGLVHRKADVLYRHTLTFRKDGGQEWTVRCSVKDPDRNSVGRVSALAAQFGAEYSDMRYLTVHPDDTPPAKGAMAAWDGGELEILEWFQDSDFHGSSRGVAKLRR